MVWSVLIIVYLGLGLSFMLIPFAEREKDWLAYVAWAILGVFWPVWLPLTVMDAWLRSRKEG